jgi:hypothetical protein
VLIEAVAVSDYLNTIKAKTLDRSRYGITESIVKTDIEKLSQLANSSGKGWSDAPASGPSPFVRNVALLAEHGEPGQLDE